MPAATTPNLAGALRMSVARLSRRLRTERDDASPVAITGLTVLAALNREGDLTVGQLAHVERVQPPSMTRTVSCLERDGFVARSPHPDDGRQVLVGLTDPGRALFRAELRRREAWFAQRLAELTSEERGTLAAAVPILERLSDA